MSRSDTFDSDVFEVERPNPQVSRSLPWISAPVLQNTTCSVLLDPRKLLCESSSIVALIPCQTISSVKPLPKSPQPEETIVKDVSSSVSKSKPVEAIDDSTEIPLNVFQSDLLSEILSSANALQLLGSDMNILSPNSTLSKPIDEDVKENIQLVQSSTPLDNSSSKSVCTQVEIDNPVVNSLCTDDAAVTVAVDNTKTETENQEALTSWCFEGDDGFRDVIEAINRLCDTMSTSGSNLNTEDEASSFSLSERCDNTEERITEQPKTKTRMVEFRTLQNPGDLTGTYEDIFLGSSMQLSSVSVNVTAELPLNITDSIDSSIYPQTPESLSTPEVTGDEVVNLDSSVADSSSPAVIEDDSSTNHTDLLQFSLCSSSLNNDDSALYLMAESHLPNPEEVPPPGHVAAMRVKFETITNVNVNTMRLLRNDEA